MLAPVLLASSRRSVSQGALSAENSARKNKTRAVSNPEPLFPNISLIPLPLPGWSAKYPQNLIIKRDSQEYFKMELPQTTNKS